MISIAEIQKIITQAIHYIPIIRPLKEMVAVNPFEAFTQQPVHKINESPYFQHLIHTRVDLDVAEKTCIHFLGLGLQQHNPLFSSEDKLNYECWKEDAKYLHGLSNTLFETLSSKPLEAIQQLLLDCNAAEGKQIINGYLFAMRGWVGLIKYYHQVDCKYYSPEDFLAMLLTLKKGYHISIVPNIINNTEFSYPFREMFSEHHHLSRIFDDLEKPAQSLSVKATSKAAFIFCMDTRSEFLRKKLEGYQAVQTFGVAGFFGLPFEYVAQESEQTKSICPVIASPLFKVFQKELALQNISCEKQKPNHNPGHQEGFATCGYIEILGLSYLTKFIWQCFKSKQKKHLSFRIHTDKIIRRLQEEGKIAVIVNALAILFKMMGYTRIEAKEVFFCGHFSDINNNHYEAKLQCGACGGQSGIYSAILVSNLLNSILIRNQLRKLGIEIAASTTFYPLSHDTASQNLLTLENSQSNKVISKEITCILSQINKSGIAYIDAQYQNYARKTPVAGDWSEVQPDWGLMNNRLLVIGPRDKTRETNLAGTSFLHCYDKHSDPTGDILMSILEGPAVVALGINMQYNLSTLFHKSLSSHYKTTHNIVGDSAVMQGGYSDIQIGFPLESIKSGQQFQHKPIKLHIIVCCQKQQLVSAVQKSGNFKLNFINGWCELFFLDANKVTRLVPEDVQDLLAEDHKQQN